MKCPNCSYELSPSTIIARSTLCPNCSAQLHACRFCRFYDEAAHYNCREDIDEYVADKENANFCDRFSLSDKAAGKKDESKKAEALARLNALFGG